MFFKVETNLIPVEDVGHISIALLEERGMVTFYMKENSTFKDITAYNIEALDALMRVCPQALEGRKLRWLRHRWAFHNLVAHPVMQLCAFVGLTKLGLKLHDHTVPRPHVLHDEAKR